MVGHDKFQAEQHYEQVFFFLNKEYSGRLECSSVSEVLPSIPEALPEFDPPHCIN